jgi:hypothetical protein
MLGARPGEDVDIAHAFLQRGGIHLFNFAAGDGGPAVTDVQHLGDGRGRNLMIASDHRHANATAVAFLHCLDRLLAWWIEKPD